MTTDPILARFARMQRESDQRARRALGIPASDTPDPAPGDEAPAEPDWLRQTINTTTARGRITNPDTTTKD